MLQMLFFVDKNCKNRRPLGLHS